MKQEKVIILVSWLVASGLLSMTIWGSWAKSLYQKKKDNYWIWYWLRFFHVELTERNCILFIKGTSILGLFLVTVGCLAALILAA
jgi:hypothetical protein